MKDHQPHEPPGFQEVVLLRAHQGEDDDEHDALQGGERRHVQQFRPQVAGDFQGALSFPAVDHLLIHDLPHRGRAAEPQPRNYQDEQRLGVVRNLGHPAQQDRYRRRRHRQPHHVPPVFRLQGEQPPQQGPELPQPGVPGRRRRRHPRRRSLGGLPGFDLLVLVQPQRIRNAVPIHLGAAESLSPAARRLLLQALINFRRVAGAEVRQQFIAGAEVGQLAPHQHRHLVQQAERPQQVRGDDYGRAPPRNLPEQPHHFHFRLRVLPRRGLVQKQQPGLAQEFHPQADPLALASTQLQDGHVSPLPQVQAANHLEHPVPDVLVPVVVREAEPGGVVEAFLRGEGSIQHVLLRDVPDQHAQGIKLVVKVPFVQQHPAPLGWPEAVQRVHQRSFSRPGGPQEPHELAGLNRQRDIVQQHQRFPGANVADRPPQPVRRQPHARPVRVLLQLSAVEDQLDPAHADAVPRPQPLPADPDPVHECPVGRVLVHQFELAVLFANLGVEPGNGGVVEVDVVAAVPPHGHHRPIQFDAGHYQGARPRFAEQQQVRLAGPQLDQVPVLQRPLPDALPVYIGSVSRVQVPQRGLPGLAEHQFGVGVRDRGVINNHFPVAAAPAQLHPPPRQGDVFHGVLVQDQLQARKRNRLLGVNHRLPGVDRLDACDRLRLAPAGHRRFHPRRRRLYSRFVPPVDEQVGRVQREANLVARLQDGLLHPPPVHIGPVEGAVFYANVPLPVQGEARVQARDLVVVQHHLVLAGVPADARSLGRDLELLPGQQPAFPLQPVFHGPRTPAGDPGRSGFRRPQFLPAVLAVDGSQQVRAATETTSSHGRSFTALPVRLFPTTSALGWG